MGVAYRHKGMFPDAIAAFEKAITRQPDFVEALMQLGYIYRETERFTKATEIFYRSYADISDKRDGVS